MSFYIYEYNCMLYTSSFKIFDNSIISAICVSIILIFFPGIFLLVCMAGYFYMGSRHCELYIIECSIFPPLKSIGLSHSMCYIVWESDHFETYFMSFVLLSPE